MSHKRGGPRKGAGAKPKYNEPTRPKTFRFPESIAEHIDAQGKRKGTAYIIKLIEADMQNSRDNAG